MRERKREVGRKPDVIGIKKEKKNKEIKNGIRFIKCNIIASLL